MASYPGQTSSLSDQLDRLIELPVLNDTGLGNVSGFVRVDAASLLVLGILTVPD